MLPQTLRSKAAKKNTTIPLSVLVCLHHLTASYRSQPEARVLGWLALASDLAIFTISYGGASEH
jgi:hypothetical protein